MSTIMAVSREINVEVSTDGKIIERVGRYSACACVRARVALSGRVIENHTHIQYSGQRERV